MGRDRESNPDRAAVVVSATLVTFTPVVANWRVRHAEARLEMVVPTEITTVRNPAHDTVTPKAKSTVGHLAPTKSLVARD